MASSVNDKFHPLETEMLKTFFTGCGDQYPESHSDLCQGLRALMKRFEITARAIPLDWKDLFDKP